MDTAVKQDHKQDKESKYKVQVGDHPEASMQDEDSNHSQPWNN